jgi:putative hemolysin
MFVVWLITVLFLVALNGFFVAAEFALVAVRLSRIRQLIQKGNSNAVVVKELIDDLDRVLSGVQVGITLASLALGYVGESTLVRLFLPLFWWLPGPSAQITAHATAIVLGFSIITFLHVVLGELVPKSLSLQRSERIALLLARPLLVFLNVFRWPIRVLDRSSQLFVRLFGVAQPQTHSVAHSPEELQIQIQQARERGLLAPSEEKVILSAIELGEIQVREIMVPRPDMHLLPVEASLDEALRAFATTQRSRIPVYRGTVDHILGLVHIKDILWVLQNRERRAAEGLSQQAFDLRRVLREILIVPETKPATELLSELRTRHTGMAVVVDEFGSVLGLVTLEDILEQIVGEIHDEFDVVEKPLTLADGAVIFDAALNVRDLEAQYGIAIPEDPAYATVGGFVLDQLGFIPSGGESFVHGDLRFTVVEMDGKRVARVKMERVSATPGKTPDKTNDDSETSQGKPAKSALSRS